MSQFPDAKQWFTTVTEGGKWILEIEPYDVTEPREHEVVVRMEAVPIDPSDLGLLTAAANMDSVRSETVDGHPALVADVEPAMQPFFKGRAGKKLAAGDEGAGKVGAARASESAQASTGKTVTPVGGVIWERLDGKKSLAAIRDALLERYDSERRQVEEDLAEFIAMVAREGLAEKVG